MTILERKISLRKFLIFLISLFGLIVTFAATFGAANVTFLDSIKVMSSKIPLINKFIDTSHIDSSHILIVLKLRLPRIILSSLVGASLSVVGTALQGMFKNPMADPYVLGISSGASFGATVAIVLGLDTLFLGSSAITLFAFIGAIVTMLLVYSVSRVGTRVPVTLLLLAGIAISFMLSSLVSIIMVFNRDQLENIMFWIMGSVSAASWQQVLILSPVFLICTVILLSFSRHLNIMSTGEETAISLGVNVERVKKILIIASSLLVATAVSVSGVIGFVGLIIPHTVRLFIGSDHRDVMPYSIVCGAIFLVVCDTFARSIVPPMEIPVGAITSVLGAPYFLYFLYKNKKKGFDL